MQVEESKPESPGVVVEEIKGPSLIPNLMAENETDNDKSHTDASTTPSLNLEVATTSSTTSTMDRPQFKQPHARARFLLRNRASHDASASHLAQSHSKP